MNIREPQSALSLFAASCNLINRSFGSLLAFVLAGALGFILLVVLHWLHIPQLIVSLLNGLYSSLLSIMLIKLLAAKAENDHFSMADLAASSMLPLVYTIILGLLSAVVGLIVSFVGGVFLSITPWILLPLVLIFLILYVRLFFAPFAIAVRDQGPIAALFYSWQLTQGHFWKVLFAILAVALVPAVCATAVGYGLYVAIPLYFADSFNLAQPTLPWIILAIVLVGLFVFIYIAAFTYLVLLFLNMDYASHASPTVELPSTQISTPQNALPPGAGPAVSNADLQQVQILKASVHAPTEDDALSKHLEQVYQPKPDDVIEYAEEDRMPTILFDEDMAKQMEQERAHWEQEKAKSRQRAQQPHEDDSSSIKMSK